MKYGYLIATLAIAGAARADFVLPNAYGWTRGSANSTYAQWEVFTAAGGPNTPDVGQYNPTGLAFNAYDSSGGSIITASGNIYSFSVPLNVHVRAPSYSLAAAAQSVVILQVRTVGTEINPSSVNIGGVAPVEVTELYRQSLGPGGPGGGGFLVDTLYRFQLTGNAASYEVRFDSAEASMSLDRVCIDTYASTTPACYANCDQSTGAPTLTANDFQCFMNQFAAGSAYANCDESTGSPALTANDFQCFMNQYAAGCR